VSDIVNWEGDLAAVLWVDDEVVFVTGDIVRAAAVEQALVALERPVLARPFEPGELERIVTSWCAG
jgi:hypothetical protein